MKKARLLKRGSTDRTEGLVVLDFEHRQKHRFLARLESGEELAIHLPRGSVLADGDVLETEEGASILVRAADESVSVAETPDALLLTRIAYHLGNRHVALQVEPGRLSYLHDHVLDDLVRRLGAVVSFRSAPFRPEAGAYGSHTDSHGDHDHAHDHSHGHQHLHPRIHARPGSS
ncbi:MAG TPA: urease accessory protein UreE [Polyangiaceae bacterium]|jgi:urease accessory protein|nr:urease accessory protein UreE [Polyangiaceae bacterium]